MNSPSPTSIVLASSNRGKLAELQRMLGDLAVVRSANDMGVILPEEIGLTFADNAMLKARAAWNQTGQISLADDSGLEVDALEGAPGVFSARYAGPGATDEANNAKLLEELQGVAASKRTARFRSAIALVLNNEQYEIFEGHCDGVIGFEPRGSGGFGYDPIFILPDGRTMAEYTEDEKNRISHRGRAMQNAIPALIKYLKSMGTTS